MIIYGDLSIQEAVAFVLIVLIICITTFLIAMFREKNTKHEKRMEQMMLCQMRYLNVIAQATVDANIFKEGRYGIPYNPGDWMLAEITELEKIQNKLKEQIEEKNETKS